MKYMPKLQIDPYKYSVDQYIIKDVFPIFYIANFHINKISKIKFGIRENMTCYLKCSMSSEEREVNDRGSARDSNSRQEFAWSLS